MPTRLWRSEGKAAGGEKPPCRQAEPESGDPDHGRRDRPRTCGRGGDPGWYPRSLVDRPQNAPQGVLRTAREADQRESAVRHRQVRRPFGAEPDHGSDVPLPQDALPQPLRRALRSARSRPRRDCGRPPGAAAGRTGGRARPAHPREGLPYWRAPGPCTAAHAAPPTHLARPVRDQPATGADAAVRSGSCLRAVPPSPLLLSAVAEAVNYACPVSR